MKLPKIPNWCAKNAIHLIAVAAVVNVLALAYAHTGVHRALGLEFNQFETVNQDGGGGYYNYEDVPTEDIPELLPPTATQEPPAVDVEVVNLASNAEGSGAAGRHTFSMQINNTFWYAWNRFMTPPNTDNQIQGYVAGLSDPNITIGYDFGIYDAADPTQRIPEGSNVPVGKQLILKFSPYVSDNIYWFGTGYSMDSPYGEWRENAAAPGRSGGKVTCEDKDLTAQYQYTDNYAGQSMQFDVYIPLVVHPAARAISNTSGLTCGAVTQNGDGSVSATCTVAAAGSLSPSFDYGSTYGKFYYRYYDYRSNYQYNYNFVAGCYGNNIPMTTAFGQSSGAAQAGGSEIQPAAVVNFAARSFDYPLTAVQQGAAPQPPAISCSANVTTGQDVTVSLGSTDPNGDQIQYGVDWIDDGVQEVNSGWSALVPSGTSQNLVKTGGYNTPGTYNIYGWAKDATGMQSTPVSCSVAVTAQQPDLTAGGVSLPQPTAGSPVTMSATVSNTGPGTSGSFPTRFQIADQSETQTLGSTVSGYVALTAGGSQGVSAAYTFEAGTYKVRACANQNTAGTNIVTETNYGNNCGGWTTVTIAETGTPTQVTDPLACSVSDTNPQPNVAITYTASGGNGSYVWTPSGGYGPSTTGNPITRWYTTPGPYTMGLSSGGETTSCSVVTIGTVACTNPSANISANPVRVRQGGSTTVTWSATGVDGTCTVTGPGISVPPITANSCVIPNGSANATISTQSVYRISCDNGEFTDQVIVNLVPDFTEF